MTDRRAKPGGPVAFDPAKIDALLDTGGGLLGELTSSSIGRSEDHDTGRWIGVEVGSYRITEFLDRGGMSLVFRAERCDGQFEQQVAIKLLHTPDAAELAQRFERERRLLARLEHPGIARIIDSGIVQGQSWIAMELIEGEQIDAYCDRAQLSLDQRLGLFAQVARAVQFAHGRLIVHRDLKPSNILVDNDGRPKLLDFGIAKALQADAGVELTGPAMLLTPLYASPEQVLGEPVGVASDIYQLGLLLYCLLTGRNAQAMDQANVARIKSVVVDQQPLSPSLQVETTGRQEASQAERIAAARSTSVARLRRKLSGDLDTVVLHAMRKDPGQRYASVEQLIADVENFRARRPIAARPASTWYRVGRFAQRHRGGVLAGVLTLMVLLGSLIAVALSWQATIEAQAQALAEAAGAQHVGEFLAAMLEQADPSVSGGEELSVRELLDQSAGRLDELENRPRTQARLLEVIAGAYKVLGLPDRAEPLARQAIAVRERLGDLDGSIEPLRHLAVIKMDQGKLDEAVELGRRAVDAATRAGAEPLTRAAVHDALAVVLFQKGRYAEEREQLLLALAQLEGIGTDEARIMRSNSTYSLGKNSLQQGEYLRAKDEFESVLSALGEAPNERMTRMWALRDLGSLSSELGDEELAIDSLQQALEQARAIYGSDSATILGNLVLLGRALNRFNRHDEAEPFFLEALRIAEATIGKRHGNYARIQHDYAQVLLSRGQFERLRELRGEAVGIADDFFGPTHSTAVNLRAHRAKIELDEGRYPQAVSALEAVLPAVRSAFGDHHMITFHFELSLAVALMRSGEIEAAREAMLRLVGDGAEIAGGKFSFYRDNFIELARLHRLTGSAAVAREYAERAFEVHREITPNEDLGLLAPLTARIQVGAADGDAHIERALALIDAHADPMTLQSRLMLCDFAAAIAQGGYPDDARRLCDGALRTIETTLPAGHPLLAYARSSCAHAALRNRESGRATDLLQRALPVVTDILGLANWQTQWTLALLATAQNRPQMREAAVAELRAKLGDLTPLANDLPRAD